MESVEKAYRKIAEGAPDEARAILDTAGQAGDATALAELAVWHLTGEQLPRNLPAARALLRRAVAIGHVDAALMEVALTANGSGAPPDWANALRLLRLAASGDPIAAHQLALVETMDLDEKGAPRCLPEAKPLSASPHVVRFTQLLTPDECSHVADVANALLEPAVVVDPATGEMIAHPIRTSFGALIGPANETLAIQAINRRIAYASGTAVEFGEPLAVLRYAPGQQYRPHFDSIAGARNQRTATMLVYLNQGYTGGETHFMANGLSVVARAGDAILFRNVLANGQPDPRSQHAGLEVRQGVKWLATRWIREAVYDPWHPN